MNTFEAIEYMKKGGKICLKDWPPFYFIYIKNNIVYDSNNKIFTITVNLWKKYLEPDMLFSAARCESDKKNKSQGNKNDTRFT